MGEFLRTDTPPGEVQDPFPIEDGTNLDKLFFQVKRALRYIDTESHGARASFNNANAFDEHRIAQLQQEIDGYEGSRAPEAAAIASRKRQNKSKNKLKQIYVSDKELQEQERKMRESLAELTKEKRVVEKNIMKLKKTLGTKLDTSTKLISTYNRTEKAEREIDHANKTLGLALAENEKMRDVLSVMRSHYAKYIKVKNHFEEKLINIKYDISTQIKIANENLRLRRGIVKRLDALVDQRDKDTKAHISEFRDLKQTFKHLHNLRTFVTVKLDTRHTQLLAELMHQRIDEAAYAAHEDKAIANYQQAIDAIKHITGETDIQVICNTFAQKDRDILSMTYRVNQLRLENDDALAEAALMYQNVQKEKGLMGGERMENETILKLKESNFSKIAISMEDMEEKIKAYKKVVDLVQIEVKEMIRILSIEKAKFKDKMVKPKFDYSGVIEYLVLLSDACLASVLQAEHRKMITEFGEEWDNFAAKPFYKVIPQGPPPFLLKIKPPNIPNQGNGIEDDRSLRLLHREELMEKAKAVVLARETLGRQPSEDSLLQNTAKPKNKTRNRLNSM